MDESKVQSEEAQVGMTGYRPIPAFVDWHARALDTSAFDRYAALFAETKDSATEESLSHALTTATRYAAVDTGAIEGLYAVDRGFTRTVATQAAAWESVLDARGPSVRNAFEDALSGYEYVLDAATKRVEISEVWIRELHVKICASQDTYTIYTDHGPQESPLPKGVYKTLPNSPSLPNGRVHSYAPVLDTAPEMHRLVTELRSEAFLSAHPVLQAAYAHYAYVCIHPFADGNGRVARALASVYLYRSPGVPLVVFADQKNEYFDALEAADMGRPEDFVAFIGTRAIDTIGIMRVILQNNNRPSAESLAMLGSLFEVSADYEEIQAAGLRLKSLATSEMLKQLQDLSLPSRLTREGSGNQVASVAAPSHYGAIGKEGYLYFRIYGEWPVPLNFINSIAVFVRADDRAESDLLIKSSRDDGLEVMVRELSPVATEVLKLKLTSWMEGQFDYVLADLARQASEARH